MTREHSIKGAIVVILVFEMLFITNISAFAWSAYAEASGDAGSTRVTAEVGFNGTGAYAKVSATQNVDASMYGIVRYVTADGAQSSDLDGGFYQSTYGQVEGYYAGNVYETSCYFDVSSDSGSWTNHLLAH